MAGELIETAIAAIVTQIGTDLTTAVVDRFPGLEPDPSEIFPRSWWPRSANPARVFVGVVNRGFVSERLEKGAPAQKWTWRVELHMMVHHANNTARDQALITTAVGVVKSLQTLEDSTDFGSTQWTLDASQSGDSMADHRGKPPYAGMVVVVPVYTGPEP